MNNPIINFYQQLALRSIEPPTPPEPIIQQIDYTTSFNYVPTENGGEYSTEFVYRYDVQSA